MRKPTFKPSLRFAWTIKNKVRLMLAVSLAGILLLIAFMLYYMHADSTISVRLHGLNETISEAKEMNYNMEKARKFEQKYLRTPSKDTAKIVLSTVTNVKENAAKRKKQQHDPTLKKKFASIEKAADDYILAFKQLTSSQEIVGYSEKDGLRKILLEDLATLQKTIGKDHPDLAASLREMEMQRKIFMATKDEAVYQSFSKAADELNALLRQSNIDSDLSMTLLTYTNSFKTVYRAVSTMKEAESGFSDTAEKVEQGVSTIAKQLDEQKQQLMADQNRLQHLLTLILIILSIIIFAGLTFFGIWLLRTIEASISSLKEGATIIGEGNLAHRVNVNTEDEMGELAKTFNFMAEKMQRTMQKVLDAAGRLSSSSQNLAAVSEETTAQANEVNEAILQVSAGAQNQANHLEEGMEHIALVTSAVAKTSGYGSEIAEQSSNAERQGKAGIEKVDRLKETSDQFMALTSKLIDEVKQTNEQSEEIESIVKTIKDIAGNTDLLALNAAIESARAGEAGNGFAVVAKEIRKLAERSKTEAQRIQKLVSAIGTQMGKLAEEANLLNEYREEQADSVTQTKGAFDEIVANVGAISDKIKLTRDAIQQVERANKDLSAKIEEVSAISEESAASAEQVAASSDHQKEAIEQVNRSAMELQTIAFDLQSEVDMFHLTDENDEEHEEPSDSDDWDGAKQTAAAIEE
ncbi:MAG TPA: methyl-accepting chemotaxis protein [Bacillales bacterium]|nr:methyl-accepting chemotaxis protein [Bacillales bacterium]